MWHFLYKLPVRLLDWQRWFAGAPVPSGLKYLLEETVAWLEMFYIHASLAGGVGCLGFVLLGGFKALKRLLLLWGTARLWALRAEYIGCSSYGQAKYTSLAVCCTFFLCVITCFPVLSDLRLGNMHTSCFSMTLWNLPNSRFGKTVLMEFEGRGGGVLSAQRPPNSPRSSHR